MGDVDDKKLPNGPSKGRPLTIDPNAASADPNAPAFLARPEGCPVYHGFPVLHDVAVEGFIFGKISDFESGPCSEGDAFVVAPDNSRAGLVWEVSAERHFYEVSPPEALRWGVWDVAFPHPMNSRENARKNLEFILPMLKQKWTEWRNSRKA
jgi:hypothetical protein